MLSVALLATLTCPIGFWQTLEWRRAFQRGARPSASGEPPWIAKKRRKSGREKERETSLKSPELNPDGVSGTADLARQQIVTVLGSRNPVGQMFYRLRGP
jgi:hypothetical protein